MKTQKTQSLESAISRLTNLLIELQNTSTTTDKVEILNGLPLIHKFLKEQSDLQNFLSTLNLEQEFCLKSILAIEQGPIVFNLKRVHENKLELLKNLINHLVEINKFYNYMGGIIGYHLMVLKMISNRSNLPFFDKENIRLIHPEGPNISQYTGEIKNYVRKGIENLPQVAGLYPVGGAGDRLDLKNSETGCPLPAAMLDFLGRTLLEGLVRDLQAQEYLYFKLFGKQLSTPIVYMTSPEKNNHEQILNICKKHHYFGRESKDYFIFNQPLVPVITVNGEWSLSAPLTLSLKPGGHGVIWKLAEENGVFDKICAQGYTKSLIRQINNPLAGTDYNLLCLMGLGCHDDKAFGFLSCERYLNTSEGTNVLIEKRVDQLFEYCLTNIEYTDFAQRGIGEVPAKPGSPYSMFPTNTNILFANISSIQKAIKICPIPGLIINMKSQVSFIDAEGKYSLVDGGRLESTMQNIADCFVDIFSQQLNKKELSKALKTFIAYNKRSKTISTTKISYKNGESPTSTPEQAYYDIQVNNLDLLQNACEFKMPPLGSLEDFLNKGPGFIFLYHPALGPLYSIINQKLRKGSFAYGSELQLEIAEVDISELDLKGSLCIESSVPLGHIDALNILRYGQSSRCQLHRVTVRNQGIDFSAKNCFWKNKISHHECLKIILHEGAEFHAEDIMIEGNHTFEVPAWHRLTLKGKKKEWMPELQKISAPTWDWKYSFGPDNAIVLERVIV